MYFFQFKNPDGTHGDLLSLHSAEQTEAVMKYVYNMYPNLGSVSNFIFVWVNFSIKTLKKVLNI